MKEQEQYNWSRLLVHVPLILLGVVVAVAIARSGVAQQLAGYGMPGLILGALVCGALYSSIFTVAPATIGFVEFAQTGSPIWIIALCGGVGAMLGDMTLFQVIKIGFIDDLIAHFQRRSQGRYERLFKIRFFKLLLVVIGAIIVATPIPDEIGLAMMGLGRARWKTVMVVSFIFNTLGIASIAFLSR